jgi:hypothetical protein
MSARSKPPERALRRQIAQRIDDGQLPLTIRNEVTAGPGSGDLCPACSRPVTFTQAEYEAEYGRAGSRYLLKLHRGCYVLWQAECRRRISGRGRRVSPKGRATQQNEA